MTRSMLSMLAALTAVTSLVGMPAHGQEAIDALRLTVREDSKLWIEGSSNLKAWSCKATSLEADISVDSSWDRAISKNDVSKLVRRVDVKVPVRALKCGNGKMESIMYDALRAGDAGSTYILASFEAVRGETADDLLVRTVGTLSIAGTEKPVRMNVRAERLADGTIRAVSEVPIRMTDYGVKPPTALLGAIRTGNEVVVKFELFVASRSTVVAAAGGR
jgi:polyisoprenoid-binding protein YceI